LNAGNDSTPIQSRSGSPRQHASVQSDDAERGSRTIEDMWENSQPQTENHDGQHPNDLASTEIAATEMEALTLDWDANVAPTLESADFKTWAEGKATLVPGRPDFLMSYATLPGSKAYRDREFGTLYINHLASCLRQRLEIDRALKQVTRDVSEELRERDVEDDESRFQLPFHLTSGMDKLIRL